MMRLQVIFFTLVATLLTHSACAASYRDLVVMVEARFGESGVVDLGAGLVVDETPQRTVIVTALHIIEKAQPASRIRVEFSALRGKTYAATTTAYYANPSMDLAVLFVERSSPAEPPRALSETTRKVVSPSHPKALVGSNVQVIGAMGRERWSTGVKTDRVIAGGPDEIVIASDEARAGASGGAVFDTYGRLVAMTTRVEPPKSLVALPMRAIMNQLERWGIPAGISNAEAGSSASELLTQLKSDLRVAVKFQQPERIEALNGPPFEHEVSARLSSGLLALTPTIEISYAPVVNNTKKLELRPPAYSAPAREYLAQMTAVAWAVFPDGRRLGPMPISLDFETEPVAYLNSAGEKGKASLNYARQISQNEQKRAEIGEQRRRQAQADSERANRETEMALRPRRLSNFKESFKSWSLRCSKQEAAWTCEYPPFASQDVEKFVFSMKVGVDRDDLPVDIPRVQTDEFRPLFVAEIVKLLSASDQVENVFIRIQLESGEVLGPKSLCHVRWFKTVPAFATCAMR